MSPKPRLLLTSVTRPFGKRHGDAKSTTTLAMHQLNWAQDIFKVDMPAYHWGLDVIAHNIQTPTVVLHYPTLQELVREVRKGYEYVGISFIPPTFHKLKRMVPLIRSHAPHSKIILGCYGTALSDEILEGHYDLICREDGIAFFRRLFNEPERPFRTPPFVVDLYFFSLPIMGKAAPIFGGLGCSNGCDFCATSHYFKKQHIRFLKTGKDVLDAILEVKRADPAVESFVVYDEDFLLNKRRGLQFLEACRQTDERFTLSVFASVKALSQYDVMELAEMGVTWTWVGFEAMQANYDKQKGKSYRQLFAELKSVGIQPAASMIIGYDYQTLDVIEREYAAFLKLKPALSQFLIYGPSRNSPLYCRLLEENRLNEVVDLYPMHDGFTLAFDHPHLSPPTMKLIARQMYQGEYHWLGPTIYRNIEIALQGYRNLKNSTARRLKVRARMFREGLEYAHALKRVGILYAPNNLVRARIEKLYDELEAEVGPPSPKQQLLSYLLVPLGLWTKFRFKTDLFCQVPPRRYEYNTGAAHGVDSMPKGLLGSLVDGGLRLLA